MALLLSLVAAFGVFLLWTAVALGWSGLGLGPALEHSLPGRRSRRFRGRAGLAALGLGDVRLAELLLACSALFLLAAALAWVVFGGTVVPVLVGGVVASAPVAAARRRRQRRRDLAREAWPRLIEEMRLHTSTLGRSLPQALIAVGRRSPDELQGAFAKAEREWFLSTDFARALAALKAELADPTADAVCETLLVAHTVGGTDIDARLQALVEDREQDLQGRKDALAKQAGARFARRFVIGVPIGMALAGLSIGDGRAAYATAAGQVGVVVAMVLTAVCWAWAGRIMRLPTQQRVFGS